MATNEILPFASTTAADNLITQANYLADAGNIRTVGNVPGIADDRLVNKALRQCSIVVAALGQFVADRQAVNITDSLTVANLATYIADAITALINTIIVQATTTIQGKIELATQAEVDAITDADRAVTPSRLGNGFAKSLTADGYIKLPSWLGGLIVQWGLSPLMAPVTNTAVTFPIAFPTNSLAGFTSHVNTAANMAQGDNYICQIRTFSLTTITLRNLGPLDANYYWMAIGY